MLTSFDRNKAFIESLIPEVTKNVQGRVITVEGEDDDPKDKDEPVSQ